MKLKDYIAGLVQYAEKNPEAMELEVVYSQDDEGNGHSRVYHTGAIGRYENGEFETDAMYNNAVCIN